jgi:DNA polymerase III delta subunit
MKPVLLHGPAVVSSRLKLNQFKKEFSQDSITEFSEGSNPSDILGSLQTVSMFDENRLIVVENPPDDLLSSFSTNYLPAGRHGPLPTTLLLWVDHEISEKKEIYKSIQKLNGQILFFPEGKEVSIFPFLDLLANKDKRAFVELEKLKKGGFDNQYIITMCFYMLRSLIAPNKSAPDFVKRKIAKQRQNFSDNEIKNLYRSILKLDYKIKNGLIEGNQAEFLLVNKFLN